MPSVRTSLAWAGGGALLTLAVLAMMHRGAPRSLLGALGGGGTGYCCVTQGQACVQGDFNTCAGLFINGTTAADQASCDNICGVPGYCCKVNAAGPGRGSCTQTAAGSCVPPNTTVWHGTDQAVCNANVASNCSVGLSVCGNNQIESGENCDDGNRTSDDGCSETCLAESPSGSTSTMQCSDGLDNDADGDIDNYDYGCYINSVFTPSLDDETDPVCPSAYTLTTPSHVWEKAKDGYWQMADDGNVSMCASLGSKTWGGAMCDNGGWYSQTVDCGGAPGPGWTLQAQQCLYSDVGGCYSMACLWKHPTDFPRAYIVTDTNEHDQCSSPGEGYNLVSNTCVVYFGNDICLRPVKPFTHDMCDDGTAITDTCRWGLCLWEKLGVAADKDLRWDAPPFYRNLSTACPARGDRDGGCKGAPANLYGKIVKTELCLPMPAVTCTGPNCPASTSSSSSFSSGNSSAQSSSDVSATSSSSQISSSTSQGSSSSSSPDSRHRECADLRCIAVPGPGPDFCGLDSDCAATHAGCRGGECVQVEGPGDPECFDDEECESSSSSRSFSLFSSISSSASSRSGSSAVSSFSSFTSFTSSPSSPLPPSSFSRSFPPLSSASSSSFAKCSPNLECTVSLSFLNACLQRSLSCDGTLDCSGGICGNTSCNGQCCRCISRPSSSSRSLQSSSFASQILGRCGNRLPDPGEECDLGDRNGTSPCSSTCHLLRCGDTILSPHLGEECEPTPNAPIPHCALPNTDRATCSATCRRILLDPCPENQPRPICGDGILQPAVEQCDPPAPGCSRYCLLEPRPLPRSSTPSFAQLPLPVLPQEPDRDQEPTPLCGNSQIDPPKEECDDGNQRDFDGCTSTCQSEIGVCGDGIVQSLLGEQCEPSLHDPALPYQCEHCRLAFTFALEEPASTLVPTVPVPTASPVLTIPTVPTLPTVPTPPPYAFLPPSQEVPAISYQLPGILQNLTAVVRDPEGSSDPERESYKLEAHRLPQQPQTGPEIIAVMAAGAAGGLAYMRRRQRR